MPHAICFRFARCAALALSPAFVGLAVAVAMLFTCEPAAANKPSTPTKPTVAPAAPSLSASPLAAEIDRLLPSMSRSAIIASSLNGRGVLVQTRSMEEACAISNRVAPEHLEVSSSEPHRWEPLLRHAGAIFLGAYTSESLGDYCAGPNHVLPTGATARFSSPLGVYDFQKRSSLVEVSAAGAQVLGRVASVLAHGEGLQAHALAAEMRLE